MVSSALAAPAFSRAAVSPADGSASIPAEVSWEESWSTLPGKPRPIVSKIFFFGNRSFESKKLQAKVATRFDSFWGRNGLAFGGNRRASKDWKYKDIGLLTAFYRSRGFLNVSVGEIFYQDTLKNELWVRIDIQEGNQSFFGPVSFAGDAPEFVPQFQKAASVIVPDSAFNVYAVDHAIFLMKEILSNNGHPYAKIFLDTLRAPDRPERVPLVFRIEKDGLVRFGSVEISGLLQTNPKVVRRELAFKPGETYSRAKIIKSQQQVYATGLFNFVTLTAKQKPDSAAADSLRLFPDFVLRAVERKNAGINLHIGIGQFQQRQAQRDLTLDLAAGWEHRNLGGMGRRLAFSARTAFLLITDYRLVSNRFSADYTQPWLFSTRAYGNLSASFEPAVRDPVSDFRVQTATQVLTFFYPFDLTSRLTLALSLEELNIFDLSPTEVDALKLARGLNERRKISLAYEKDTRSNILIPTGGSYTRLEAELLGGPLRGDANFMRYNFLWNRYQPLAGGNIFASRLRLGQAILIGDRGNLPYTDRYFLGGANSLRGYPENSIGPTFVEGRKTLPAGGKTLLLASLELRRPIFWRFWGNLFSDFGNVYQINKDIVPDNILVTVGAGLEFITLIGPLRVEYGKRVIHGANPPGERIHFSVLFAF